MEELTITCGLIVDSLIEVSSAEVNVAASQAEEPASDDQAEAGNYKKGHINLHGFDISIENAKGSERSGTNKEGKAWSITLPAHYGYIKGTEGKDKDHIDVYIGPHPKSEIVYVVNQHHEEGGFDEHKVMLGFTNKKAAVETYDAAFTGSLGPRLRNSVIAATMDEFKDWLESGKTKKEFRAISEAIVERIVELDDQPVEEIAADFVENEVGRFDWLQNWTLYKEKHDAFVKVRKYLSNHRINARPEEVIGEIDRMARSNPGRWV